jgi:hypothetical protein
VAAVHPPVKVYLIAYMHFKTSKLGSSIQKDPASPELGTAQLQLVFYFYQSVVCPWLTIYLPHKPSVNNKHWPDSGIVKY